MDKEQFGKFVADLRKEKGLTQKELGEKLNLTDKAISKWERGLSFPDICVLEDLASELDVSISELLNGKKNEKNEAVPVKEVNDIIGNSLMISDAEIKRKWEHDRLVIMFCIVLMLLFFSVLLNISNYSKIKENEELINNEYENGEEPDEIDE